MSHLEPLDIDFDRSLEAQPLSFSAASMMVLWGLLSVGVVTFCIGIFVLEPARFWAAYYVNVLFWMGLAVGSVMIAVITQIVGAEWVVPVRRVAEAVSYTHLTLPTSG